MFPVLWSGITQSVLGHLNSTCYIKMIVNCAIKACKKGTFGYFHIENALYKCNIFITLMQYHYDNGT